LGFEALFEELTQKSGEDFAPRGAGTEFLAPVGIFVWYR